MTQGKLAQEDSAADAKAIPLTADETATGDVVSLPVDEDEWVITKISRLHHDARGTEQAQGGLPTENDANEDSTSAASAVPLDERVISGVSKGDKSIFTFDTGTTIVTSNAETDGSLDVSRIGEEDSEKGDAVSRPIISRHLIFCAIILALVMGAVIFIIFDTGIWKKFKMGRRLKGRAQAFEVLIQTPATGSPTP